MLSKQILNTKEIGGRIKELRIKRGLDQQQLANIIGVGRSQMSNLETGKRNFNLKQLKTLAAYFNVSFETLGFQNEDKVEALDLLERAKLIFLSENVPQEEKQNLYDELMKIYLESKK